MIRKTLRQLYDRALILNNRFYFYGVPKSDYKLRDDKIELTKLDIVLDEGRNTEFSIIKGYPYAVKIKQALQARFRVAGDDVFVEFNDLKLRINSAEELFIIYEVFVLREYNYQCRQPAALIDIGMNAAITSLFYAQNPLIEKIFAFELFSPTYQLGMFNLELNPTVSSKVVAQNVGLSDKDICMELEYSPSRKGRMGLRGLPTDESFVDTKKEQVVVRDIAAILEGIIAECPQLDIVIKMDCEGEEFNLIRRLGMTTLLEKINVLMIEWHFTAPTEIENILKRFGFNVFSQRQPTLNSGMIYASR